MCYVMSKEGDLSDRDRHWHPHLMFFVGNSDEAAWGASLKGSPVYAWTSQPEPITSFLVAVEDVAAAPSSLG